MDILISTIGSPATSTPRSKTFLGTNRVKKNKIVEVSMAAPTATAHWRRFDLLFSREAR